MLFFLPKLNALVVYILLFKRQLVLCNVYNNLFSVRIGSNSDRRFNPCWITRYQWHPSIAVACMWGYARMLYLDAQCRSVRHHENKLCELVQEPILIKLSFLCKKYIYISFPLKNELNKLMEIRVYMYTYNSLKYPATPRMFFF